MSAFADGLASALATKESFAQSLAGALATLAAQGLTVKFDRDEETGLTTFVSVIDDATGAVVRTITPIRDLDGYLLEARIELLA